jgi:2-keto-3-deoxy-L-fuconate dehydrogenase
MTDRVSEKIIFVTAAGQGIGRAAALALANEGARVLATDLDVEAAQAVAHEHENITGHRLDVRDPEAIDTVVDNYGPFDVLVNCAGFVHDGSVLNCTDAEWDFAFELNAKAVFRLSRAVLPGMLDKQSGSIINIASVASSLKGVPRRCAYGASKAAVIGLTKSIAADFVASGIRCNAICPGTVESPSLRDRLEATGDVARAREAFIARQPMGRFGKADEIAAVVVHLASDESAFTSGQALAVDGGWTI